MTTSDTAQHEGPSARSEAAARERRAETKQDPGPEQAARQKN